MSEQQVSEVVQLHPDLLACKGRLGNGMDTIQHPLVYSVPYMDCAFENERLNLYYAHAKGQLKSAMDAGDFHKFVFTHQRPYRLDALLNVKYLMEEDHFLELMFQVYTDSENIWQNYDEWELLLDEVSGTDPWKTLHELPDGEFKIYRGGTKDGFSWTLSYEKAKWFANRLGATHPVWHAIVKREDCIGYYDERGEKEVIVFPRIIAHRVMQLDPRPASR